VARLIPSNRILAIASGAFLGILFPMCECGIIPVMRRLLRKGVPLSCCVCYMLAGPIINVVVMLSTYVAFSGTESSIATIKPAATAADAMPVASSPGKASTSPPSTSPAPPIQSTTPGQPPVPGSVPTAPQLGGIGMTAMRVFLGFLVAFGTGLIVESQYRRHGNNLLAPLAVPPALPVISEDENNEKASWSRRVALISETALHDFVDIT